MTQPERNLPEVGSLWERDDEVFRVEGVYEAKTRDGRGGFVPITLVKHICVQPMPNHVRVARFLELYEPYDPEAE